MRITKNPEERRAEILTAAERLFCTKGYSHTAMSDIAGEIGIAKGTLYYHFQSKEEVMEAIICSVLTRRVERAKQILADKNKNAADKLFLILADPDSEENKKQEENLTEQFHQPENAQMHQKSMQQVILLMAPVLAEVVEQGIEEGIFSTDYPLESVELLLTSSSVLFDKSLFHRSEEEGRHKARAFIYSMERIIGAKKGSFNEIIQFIDP